MTLVLARNPVLQISRRSDHCLISGRTTLAKYPEFAINESLAHGRIAQGCLVYLLFFSNYEECQIEVEFTARIAYFKTKVIHELPLASYVAQYWGSHGRTAKPSDILTRLDLELLQLDGLAYEICCWLHNVDKLWSSQRLDADANYISLQATPLSPLYYVFLIGINDLVTALLQWDGYTHDDPGGFGDALQAVSFYGHRRGVC